MPSTDLIIVFASGIVLAIWAICTLANTPSEKKDDGTIEIHARWTHNGVKSASKNWKGR